MGRYQDLLDGLQLASTAAVAGAITRTVAVVNREPAWPYEGPFPLLLHGPLDLDDVVINSGQLGQDAGHPALFSAVIFDRVARGGVSIAASQTDVLALIDALRAYYAQKANMRLPNSSCKGILRIRWRFDPLGMYRRTEAGVGPVAIGAIALLGLPVGEVP